MEYFVYFEIPNRTDAAKDRLSIGKAFTEYAQVKRERGESDIHPAVAPVSHELRVFRLLFSSRNLRIRRTEPCGP